MNKFHTPVFLKEVLEALDVKPGKKYIDATLGGGGHAFEILKRGGRVLGIDFDQEAIDFVKFKVQSLKFKVGDEIVLVRGNFRDIDKIARSNGFNEVSGILFDLGVSSHQLDTRQRGFSFQKNAKLDMRMDQGLKVTASDLVNGLSKGELYELFTKLGEERFARSISDAIISARRKKPIDKTGELAEIVIKTVRLRRTHIHPATRVFQALRIAVNDELNNLKEALPKAVELLNMDGKLLVISFHSLEDRIVKEQFKLFEEEHKGEIITKKPMVPSDLKKRENIRSRSAKLRIFCKAIL